MQHRLKRNLEQQGSIFQTTSDTEVLAHLIKKSKHSYRLEERAKQALSLLEGAFAFVF